MTTSTSNVVKKASETELSVARSAGGIETKLNCPVRGGDTRRNGRSAKAKKLESQIPGQDLLFDLEPYRILG